MLNIPSGYAVPQGLRIIDPKAQTLVTPMCNKPKP